MNPIHATDRFVLKSVGCNTYLGIHFLNYEGALDSVDACTVLKELRDRGVQEAYTGLLEEIYEGRRR